MRSLFLLLLLAPFVSADDPKTFPTLVNPNCSHCVDEAKRRTEDLKPTDPVLCWTRGYSEGGAIPIRFFMSKYRVISDSYGVFVTTRTPASCAASLRTTTSPSKVGVRAS